MIWLDLGLCCLMMWGAVTGYHTGWRKSLYSLGGLLCATLTAILGVTGLRLLWNRYYPIEGIIKTAVSSRLALPVMSPGPGSASLSASVLPRFLEEALKGDLLQATTGMQCFPEPLVRMLGCIIAFLSGICLWWGFFALCGFALAEGGKRNPDTTVTVRWGGAFIGLLRHCCWAVLLTGVAAPLAWLCGAPPDLLRLENSFLAWLSWQFFTSLGIWRQAF